ncbi:hypothetical protein SJ093_18045 [Citrobacter freundii]|uniref:Uncharacterized protein n=1 Tax=Citrobacter portucalensis TaxID=1639133 RepID=A0A5B0SS95_9ENTR|nr:MULTISPECIES: hypothetical protein [Citrobacter]HBB6718631.1 hypothetical protein [Serratia marcescens]HCP9940665.1 hypothetical protein [Escherichia coli]EKW5624600.1 hypothetical protein [Citrobacter freundii]KAA1140858.1 hypothetical protein D3H66_23610 [Citrobacter portucalensis]MBJ9086029.1 hypothetical protein [Citrobacter freundii]
MAVIKPKGSTLKKKFQFQVPVNLLDEYREKKELLEGLNQSVDITDNLVKAFKDAIKEMDKCLADLTSENGKNITEGTTSA